MKLTLVAKCGSNYPVVPHQGGSVFFLKRCCHSLDFFCTVSGVQLLLPGAALCFARCTTELTGIAVLCFSGPTAPPWFIRCCFYHFLRGPTTAKHCGLSYFQVSHCCSVGWIYIVPGKTPSSLCGSVSA